MPKKDETRLRWERAATKALKGKTVKAVRYMTTGEVEASGWSAAAPVIEFTDGSFIFPVSDDEGNEGGALFTSEKDIPTIPVIWS